MLVRDWRDYPTASVLAYGQPAVGTGCWHGIDAGTTLLQHAGRKLTTPFTPSRMVSARASSFLQVYTSTELSTYKPLHRVQKKGATDFFAVTFTNIDGFS